VCSCLDDRPNIHSDRPDIAGLYIPYDAVVLLDRVQGRDMIDSDSGQCRLGQGQMYHNAHVDRKQDLRFESIETARRGFPIS
jgi:hypothetical protein